MQAPRMGQFWMKKGKWDANIVLSKNNFHHVNGTKHEDSSKLCIELNAKKDTSLYLEHS